MNKDYDCMMFDSNMGMIEPVYIADEIYEQYFYNVINEIDLKLYSEIQKMKAVNYGQ